LRSHDIQVEGSIRNGGQGYVTITEQGQAALRAAIPWWEAAQSDMENGLGGDRMDRLLKDIADYLPLS
jgi:DNA-binding PadR family transcriptional regulator